MNSEIKNQLTAYFDEVIAQEYPTRKEIYEFGKESGRLERMFNQEEKKPRSGRFNEFGISAGDIPEYLGVILTTINVVIEIIRVRREGKIIKQEKIKKAIISNQIELKIPAEIAQKLIDKYFLKLNEVIEEATKEEDDKE